MGTRGRNQQHGRPRRSGRPVTHPRSAKPVLLGFVAFAGTAAHFILVYAVASTSIPWPIGTVAALAPIAVGVLLVRRVSAGGGIRGPDALRVVTGILAFFLLLDAFVGLGGRYDLTIGALAAGLALAWLNQRPAPAPAANAGSAA